jgi:hypothetical protein
MPASNRRKIMANKLRFAKNETEFYKIFGAGGSMPLRYLKNTQPGKNHNKQSEPHQEVDQEHGAATNDK